MSDPQEARLAKIARDLHYPETPDLAARFVRKRSATGQRPLRLAWGMLLLLIVLGGLLSVPPLRAAVWEFLQIGSLRVWQGQAPPAPTAVVGPTPLPSLLDLAGETSLGEAQATVSFPIPLPAFPPDLGSPDRVYLQSFDGPMVVLVWLDAQSSVALSLSILSSEVWAEKQQVRVIQETEVNGQWAVWVTGVHPLQLGNGDYQMTRLVQGNTLIWAEGTGAQTLTYRLETDLSLTEAIRVAESLTLIPKEGTK